MFFMIPSLLCLDFAINIIGIKVFLLREITLAVEDKSKKKRKRKPVNMKEGKQYF